MNRIIVDSLLEAGENAVSVQPSAGCIAEDIGITEWNLKPIGKMLDHDMLVVSYADVGSDLKRGCPAVSTEEIFDLGTFESDQRNDGVDGSNSSLSFTSQ